MLKLDSSFSLDRERTDVIAKIVTAFDFELKASRVSAGELLPSVQLATSDSVPLVRMESHC